MCPLLPRLAAAGLQRPVGGSETDFRHAPLLCCITLHREVQLKRRFVFWVGDTWGFRPSISTSVCVATLENGGHSNFENEKFSKFLICIPACHSAKKSGAKPRFQYVVARWKGYRLMPISPKKSVTQNSKKTPEGSSVGVHLQQKWTDRPGSVGITRRGKLLMDWNSLHKQITSRPLQRLFEPFLIAFILGLDGSKMSGFDGAEEEISSQKKYVQLPSVSMQINRSKSNGDTFILSMLC